MRLTELYRRIVDQRKSVRISFQKVTTINKWTWGKYIPQLSMWATCGRQHCNLLNDSSLMKDRVNENKEQLGLSPNHLSSQKRLSLPSLTTHLTNKEKQRKSSESAFPTLLKSAFESPIWRPLTRLGLCLWCPYARASFGPLSSICLTPHPWSTSLITFYHLTKWDLSHSLNHPAFFFF